MPRQGKNGPKAPANSVVKACNSRGETTYYKTISEVDGPCHLEELTIAELYRELGVKYDEFKTPPKPKIVRKEVQDKGKLEAFINEITGLNGNKVERLPRGKEVDLEEGTIYEIGEPVGRYIDKYFANYRNGDLRRVTDAQVYKEFGQRAPKKAKEIDDDETGMEM